MALDPLGPIDPVASLKAIDRIERTAPTRPDDIADSANLSTEARVVAELDAAMEIANDSPDVRADLVADVRARLQDADYLDATVIDRIAKRLQDRFGT